VRDLFSTLLAQSKKKDPAQASKYAKRGSSRAKKKDFKGALSDYKKAYQLNPTASYKKKVQQLTSLAKRQGGSNQSKSKVSKKQAAQASKYAKRGNTKAKKKDYAGALKDFQRAFRLNPTASNKKRVSQLTSVMKKTGNSQTVARTQTQSVVQLGSYPLLQ
jgi:tetratricopeptide (TPR) repeat protein